MKAQFRSIDCIGGSRPARLQIGFYVTNDSGQQGTFFEFKGQLRIPSKDGGFNFLYLGDLNNISNQTISIAPNMQSPVDLTFILDPYTKNIIEEQRDGDLTFLFYLTAYRVQVDASHFNIQNEQTQVLNDRGETLIRIPRSQWADILQDAGYGKLQIIEMPIDYVKIINSTEKLGKEGIEDRFKKSAQHLKIVMNKMNDGNWSEAVGECRLVLDNLRKDTVKDEKGENVSPIKVIENILKKSGLPSENIDGFKQLIERLYSYTSMKHHIVTGEEKEEILIPMGKEDALFVVSSTVTILNLLTKKYLRNV